VTKPSDLTEARLVEYVAAQRWYASKDREVAHAAVVDCAELPGAVIAIVEVRFPEGTHDTYQLVAGDELDGLAEPAVARELVQLIRAGGSKPTLGEGTITFQVAAGPAELGAELAPSRLIEGEQSNSAVVFDDQLILKVYRRLEAGINPELEMLQFLSGQDFSNIPSLLGWYSYVGRPAEATLGVLQEFVAGGIDGWELALDEIVVAPDRFLGRLRGLGAVTGAMHSALAAPTEDPVFAAEEPSPEALGLLTATIDEEIQRVFLDLPDDVEALEPIRSRGEEIRERLRQRAYAGAAGRVIRSHGDFHLGQTLLHEEDWVIIDFEGEPARSLPERRRKRSPLRDVAGMLRSFAYVSSAVEHLRGVEAPPEWEARARAEFLEGYLGAVDPTIVPPGPEAFERLLSVFELEKAVYELRYELTMRPDWVPIPVTGIRRILEEEPVTT
jgi:predicted trehalose synthase